MRPSKEVLLDSLISDTLDITFRAHLPKGALESRQSILPRGDGTFPAIQLPLLGKEPLLQLDVQRQRSNRI
jgi:hypothetical protein